MSNLWGREPAMILALVQAIFAVAIAFGFELTEEQLAGLVALVAVLLGVITRTRVTPVE